MLISIEKAAEIVGVSTSSLRKWEANGQIPKAKRTLGGHRRYELEDIQQVAKMMEPK